MRVYLDEVSSCDTQKIYCSVKGANLGNDIPCGCMIIFFRVSIEYMSMLRHCC